MVCIYCGSKTLDGDTLPLTDSRQGTLYTKTSISSRKRPSRVQINKTVNRHVCCGCRQSLALTLASSRKPAEQTDQTRSRPRFRSRLEDDHTNYKQRCHKSIISVRVASTRGHPNEKKQDKSRDKRQKTRRIETRPSSCAWLRRAPLRPFSRPRKRQKKKKTDSTTAVVVAPLSCCEGEEIPGCREAPPYTAAMARLSPCLLYTSPSPRD